MTGPAADHPRSLFAPASCTLRRTVVASRTLRGARGSILKTLAWRFVICPITVLNRTAKGLSRIAYQCAGLRFRATFRMSPTYRTRGVDPCPSLLSLVRGDVLSNLLLTHAHAMAGRNSAPRTGMIVGCDPDWTGSATGSPANAATPHAPPTIGPSGIATTSLPFLGDWRPVLAPFANPPSHEQPTT